MLYREKSEVTVLVVLSDTLGETPLTKRTDAPL
jgi:hypothetical protein